MCQSSVLYNPRSHSIVYATWKCSTKLITVRNSQTLHRWKYFMGWGVDKHESSKYKVYIYKFNFNIVGKRNQYSSSGFYSVLLPSAKYYVKTFTLDLLLPHPCLVQSCLCSDFTPLGLKLLGFYSQVNFIQLPHI